MNNRKGLIIYQLLLGFQVRLVVHSILVSRDFREVQVVQQALVCHPLHLDLVAQLGQVHQVYLEHQVVQVAQLQCGIFRVPLAAQHDLVALVGLAIQEAHEGLDLQASHLRHSALVVLVGHLGLALLLALEDQLVRHMGTVAERVFVGHM